MNALLETLAHSQSLPGVEGFLATLAIKGTLVLAVGFAAALFLRRAPATARHLAWCATLAGLLLVPVLAAWAPPVPLPWLAAAGADAGSALGAESPASVTVSAAAFPAAAPDEGELPAARPDIAARGSAPALPWRALLPALYLLGACAFLAYLLVGSLRARRLRRGARRLDGEPGWRTLLASLRSALGIRRPLSLEATDRIAVPLAWGVRRPTVLLPAVAEAWDDDQRRDVLVHELAHVARHDWLSQLGARVVCALYWFHPLVWVAARRLILEAERACDDRVLAAGSDSCDYAERLLQVAGGARMFREPSYAAVAMARRSDLATRIQSILDGRVRRGGLRAAHVALLAGAVLMPAGLIGPVQLARAAPTAETGSEEAARAPKPGEPAAELADLSPLLRAAHTGDLAAVRGQLDAGADPNRSEDVRDRRDRLQRSPLGAAARGGHLEVARLLLARGAEVDLTPRGDATPLIIAARHGHPGTARLLLEHGADPNRVVPGDGSPLIAAAAGGEEEIARMLLAAGADPNTWVEGDESPLFHAVNGGDREMVRLLLENGADPDVEWSGDGNALIVAAGNRRDDLVELLVAAGADPDRGVQGDGNALIHAAGRGDVATVRRLLAAGADPNAAVRGDGNPLIQAAASGHLQALRLLVESGGDVDRVVPGDENPLIQAAANGHLDVARYLLEKGADPDVRVVVGPTSWRPEGDVRTPLSMARRGGHEQVVRLLLAHGATEE